MVEGARTHLEAGYVQHVQGAIQASRIQVPAQAHVPLLGSFESKRNKKGLDAALFEPKIRRFGQFTRILTLDAADLSTRY